MESFSFNIQQSFFDTDTIETIKFYSEVFEDPEFLCEITSLINFDDDKLSDSQKLKWINYEWRRIPHIYKDKISILDNVSSSDVKQGSLGNCYLLSVCAVMAEYPNRLKKSFIVKEINLAGIYSILLHVDGLQKKITIDDRIPYDTHTKQPPFCKLTSTKNIWAMLIEKAWAKFLGNYQNTIQGHPFEIFKILTGAPTYFIRSNTFVTDTEKNALWSKLNNMYLNDYYICASTHSDKEIQINTNTNLNLLLDELQSIGLSPNHAYSCLFFYEFVSSGKIIRLVKIRNPWGCLESAKSRSNFIGEIISKNYYDIPEIKNNIGEVFKDGICILTFDEFLKYFTTISICNYHDGYNIFSQRLSSISNKNNHFQVFSVNLKYSNNPKSKIFFSINKPSKLSFIKDSQDYNSLYYSIFLGKRLTDPHTHNLQIQYIRHNEGYESTITVELESEKCEYIILVHADKHNSGIYHDENYLGYVSVYTNEENLIIEPLVDVNCNKLFENLIYDYYNVLFKISDDYTKNLKILSDGVYHNHFSLINSRYGFIIFENLNLGSLIHLSLFDINSSFDIEKDGKGIINSDIQKSYQTILSNYFIIPYYISGLKYKYKWVNVKTRDQLKIDIISFGENCSIKSYNGSFDYLKLKHDVGVCFMFQNTFVELIEISIKIKKNQNLICYEYCESRDTNKIQLFIPPYEVQFIFFDLVEVFMGFSLEYEIKFNIS